MSGLSGFSSALQAAVAFSFADAVLVQPGAGVAASNGMGGFTPAADLVTAVQAKVDTKRSYHPERGAVTETRIIILSGGLAWPPLSGNRLQFGTAWNAAQPHHVLTTVQRDGLGSHYSCGVADV